MNVTFDELARRAGEELGVSSWRTVDQQAIDSFAALSGDFGFIHVDAERARATPFGGTIAHGLLVLSLFGGLSAEIIPTIADREFLVAYGWDRIRFIAPVPVNSEIRARATLLTAERRAAAEGLLRFRVTIEVAGAGKPALAGEFLELVILKRPT